MSVSRRGKRGSRKLHPTGRNKRVRVNARMASITREEDGRPTSKRITKEQWVINCVTRAVGTRKNIVTADDVASDIIMELLNEGGFNWEEEEIEEFCRKKTACLALKALYRKERSECEFSLGDSGELSIIDLLSISRAMQETVVDAHSAAALLPLLPNRQRAALEILCDGGNPLDVAEEMGIAPWDAIVLIKEARDWIRRVGPMDWAA